MASSPARTTTNSSIKQARKQIGQVNTIKRTRNSRMWIGSGILTSMNPPQPWIASAAAGEAKRAKRKLRTRPPIAISLDLDLGGQIRMRSRMGTKGSRTRTPIDGAFLLSWPASLSSIQNPKPSKGPGEWEECVWWLIWCELTMWPVWSSKGRTHLPSIGSFEESGRLLIIMWSV